MDSPGDLGRADAAPATWADSGESMEGFHLQQAALEGLRLRERVPWAEKEHLIIQIGGDLVYTIKANTTS